MWLALFFGHVTADILKFLVSGLEDLVSAISVVSFHFTFVALIILYSPGKIMFNPYLYISNPPFCRPF